MHFPKDIIVLLLLLAGVASSIHWKKLTTPAALTGGVIGWLVYTGAGYTGLYMLAAFFILGTGATRWHGKVLSLEGHPDQNPPHDDYHPTDQRRHAIPGNRSIEHKRRGQTGATAQSTRTVGQVLANGGVAALAGLGILFWPGHRPLLEILMAASLSSATADTLSSELGMVYGRRYYNILTWRRDQQGLDGAVSIEGTLIGIAGSSIIALLYAAGHGWNSGFWIIVLSGTIGNITDSILGATLERKGRLGNNMVNFLNTLAAGLVGILLAWHSSWI
jgi:uncharacterized protein (TIGR00297 family)